MKHDSESRPAARVARWKAHFRDESSIALIITLSVMSLLLILVLTFATVTKVDLQSATANRDLIASKFLAQAALERTMADLVVQYQSDANLLNDGLLGTYSFIKEAPSNGVSVTTGEITGASTNFVTDIETVTLDPITRLGTISRGYDGVVDFVVLPNNLTNYFAGVTPQWIGMKNTNGDLIGRIAYIASGASLCINAIGNMDSHVNAAANGLGVNTRNEGLSVAELNLPAALRTMSPTTWSWANATNDAREIFLHRYNAALTPGNNAFDDNNNTTTNNIDRLDNDGDGQIDQAAPSEGLDEAQEYLGNADETPNATITAVGDDRVFTDLKELYTSGSMAAVTRNRFQSNFATIQRFFCTQSPVKMNPTLLNLNDPTYMASASAMFLAVSNKFNQISYLPLDATQRMQIACNIAAYNDTNSVAPFGTNLFGTNLVGVGQVPHLNEILYQTEATVRRVDAGSSTNISVDLEFKVSAEVWYPYTNAFPRSGTFPTDLHITYGVTTLSPIGVGTNGFAVLPVTYTGSNNVFSTFAAATPATLTNATQFAFYSANTGQTGYMTLVGNLTRPEPFTNDITVGGFPIEADLRGNAAPNDYLDIWRRCDYNNTITFRALDLTNGIAVGGFKKVTGIVSIALNDPRIKPVTSNIVSFLQHTGIISSSVHVVPARSSNKLFNSTTNLFAPNASGCDDRLATAPHTGIGTNTFYVPKSGYYISAAQLGRIHRAQQWRTIDFTGTSTDSGVDGLLLDHFTTWKPLTGTSTNYLHGRVNINTARSELPVWAALFAGMPLWDGSFVDYSAAGMGALIKTSNLTTEITARKYQSFASLMACTNLASMSSVYPTSAWPVQRTDVEREWFINRMFNLVNTKGGGNFFTVWAWGQTLKGSATDHRLKVVSGETLIVAMVRPEVEDNVSYTNINMRIVYFRYNPDLEFYTFGSYVDEL